MSSPAADAVSMAYTIERYRKINHKEEGISCKPVSENLQVKEDTISMAKKIEHLEISKRNLSGQGLETFSISELQQLENQLERSITKVRARKDHLYREQINKLVKEEKILLEKNAELMEKCGMQPLKSSTVDQDSPAGESSVDVETELFIGPPKRRSTTA